MRRLTRLPGGTWPMTTALGLAGLIFIGGLSNLSRLAVPALLYVLIAVGLAVATKCLVARVARAASARPGERKTDERIYPVVWLCLVALIGGVAVWTQLSPSAFNHHDDFQKYFVHVARMLQTGTAYGSPLNTLGSETFGGQAFVQGFAVAIGGMEYINAADAIFCFVLTLLLAGGVAIGRPQIKPIAIIAILMVWVFEAQYVSVTALYSGAVLVFAGIALSVDRREYATDARSSPPAAAIGLIYAALVALKPTFALFSVFHFLACVIGTIAGTREIRASLKHYGATALWGVVFIIPWVAPYAPIYLQALLQPVVGTVEQPTPLAETIELLSTRQLLYGGSYAQYSFAAMAPAICAAATLGMRQSRSPDAARLVAICIALPIAYLVMLLVGPLHAGYDTALRFFTPVLIGAAPATLILLRMVADPAPGRKFRRRVLVGELLVAVLAAWFVPDAISRANLLIRTGSMLAYLRSWPPSAIDVLVKFDREALRGNLQQRIAEQQGRVPAGEPVLVWTAAPFLLNFTRNPIVDADIGGLSTPWARTPRVSYVLWQYGGFGVRQPRDYAQQIRSTGRRETYLAANALAYAGRLQYLLTHSEILFNDGQTALLRVTPDMLPP